MKKIILENFRCFHGKLEIPLAPLTLLIGENSTGKSSFLAAIRLVWDMIIGQEEPDFNKIPFLLGSFDQIANFRGGRAGRAKSFTLGSVLSDQDIEEGLTKKKQSRCAQFIFTFEQKGASPQLTKYGIESQGYSILLEFFRDKTKNGNNIIEVKKSHPLKITFKTPSCNEIIDGPTFHSSRLFSRFGSYFINEIISSLKNIKRDDKKKLEDLARCILYLGGSDEEPSTLAPTRTNPLRTYDPKQELPKPTGEHIPMILSRIKATDKDSWIALKKELEEFGIKSGLFKHIDIRELGEPLVDPFQVRVNVEGPPVNLIDVGYGVSQILPILVEVLLNKKRGRMFLLQQPEIHLHPKAQAELGTLIGKLVKEFGLKFIIETHSDYILDRIRLEIRNKTKNFIDYKDFLILYFQRENSEVKIHSIKVDENGNIIKPPKGYRKFFLEEDKKYFGL